MKQIKIKIVFLAAIVLGLSSCLKEANNVLNTDKGPKNILEFANTGDNVAAASSFYPRFSSDLGVLEEGQSATFNVNVSYSGVDVAPADITVTLAVNPTVLDRFNDDNGSDYEVPPAAIYDFPTTVVIKKGTRKAQIQVKITVNDSYNFDTDYALPISIASSSLNNATISGNFGVAMYSFSARNKLDGIYTMDATAPMKDLVSPPLSGRYPIDVYLITYSGNSIALYNSNSSYYTKGYFHPIINTTDNSSSAYGSFAPVFFFDKTGKITSITNYYGQYSSANKRSAELNPAGVNQAILNADGSIKSFEVSYIMTQSDVPRTYFHEKFTYKSAR